MSLTIQTPRLVLVPATTPLVRAELDGRDALARAIGAPLAADWPPEHWDEGVLRWLLDAAAKPGFDPAWPGFYVVLCDPAPGLVIGTAGYKSPPDAQGVVELGYGIVPSHQRRGFASEATRAMIDHAWKNPRTRRVDAETYPHLAPSLGVMRVCGMTFLGPGSEFGTVRYGIARPV
ncbi:MAG: GNAT family N-acetyltransferase [Phycisphaerales bacterium]